MSSPQHFPANQTESSAIREIDECEKNACGHSSYAPNARAEVDDTKR
ncbi:hypothetical protein F441_03906 [Phytophthora nicotianae CJ01A1]|uniref:Uncharacterized protein n=1 Tax=Phytophthora nicotianae CJ01A1 TaxID=1317063 RepID=W2XJ14_PHYNI|nr:hypothetical protein F441_03906 [Phytophthora nicotianae CJ01A1]